MNYSDRSMTKAFLGSIALLFLVLFAARATFGQVGGVTPPSKAVQAKLALIRGTNP